jgi:hypothetical protein
MTIPSSRPTASAITSGNYVLPHEQVAMKHDRQEWDNEGGAVRLPAQARRQALVETMKLADILPPSIMANRRKGILRCAYND